MGNSKAKILKPSAAVLAQRQAEQDRVAAVQYGRELHYDRRNRAFRILLRSGITVTIPVAAIEELASATPAQIAAVRMYPSGSGLTLRELDLDISVPGLMREVLGFGELQQQRAGRVKTAAKAASSRANGAKGGRPRKVAASSQPRKTAKAAAA